MPQPLMPVSGADDRLPRPTDVAVKADGGEDKAVEVDFKEVSQEEALRLLKVRPWGYRGCEAAPALWVCLQRDCRGRHVCAPSGCLLKWPKTHAGPSNSWRYTRPHPRFPASCPVHAHQATEKGLTGEEAARRLQEYGPNKLPEETRNPILVYLSYM